MASDNQAYLLFTMSVSLSINSNYFTIVGYMYMTELPQLAKRCNFIAMPGYCHMLSVCRLFACLSVCL